MSEIELQDNLERLLNSSVEWRSIPIVTSTSTEKTFQDLIFEIGFDVRTEKPLLTEEMTHLSRDLFSGQTPDLALVSRLSGQTRVLIEVKQATKSTHKELDASQFVRNLLFLLSATDHRPRGMEDIHRAVLVAAPDSWFQNNRLSHHWSHLKTHYSSLAATFKITLGEIRTDRL